MEKGGGRKGLKRARIEEERRIPGGTTRGSRLLAAGQDQVTRFAPEGMLWDLGSGDPKLIPRCSHHPSFFHLQPRSGVDTTSTRACQIWWKFIPLKGCNLEMLVISTAFQCWLATRGRDVLGADGQAIAKLCGVCTQQYGEGSAMLEPVQASLAELLCALSRAPWPVRADDAQDYVILLDAMAQLLSTVRSLCNVL